MVLSSITNVNANKCLNVYRGGGDAEGLQDQRDTWQPLVALENAKSLTNFAVYEYEEWWDVMWMLIKGLCLFICLSYVQTVYTLDIYISYDY